jgi:hypothetical protein
MPCIQSVMQIGHNDKDVQHNTIPYIGYKMDICCMQYITNSYHTMSFVVYSYVQQCSI